MKYIEDFRDPAAARALQQAIAETADGLDTIHLMEVCGTHTMAICRHGVRDLLPPNVELLSGPGCPVCVTANAYLDQAIAYSRLPDCIITTFGDMMRVPGSTSSLDRERSRGGDVRVVYSTLDALALAEKHPEKRVIFLGVGFETTAPTIAASILEAERKGLSNYYVLCGHKTVPRALTALVQNPALKIAGFICPAHVSVVIGASAYEFLARDHHKACVVTGFEPLDMLEGIRRLVSQIKRGVAEVENQYDRVVRPEGNPKIQETLATVFEPVDAEWRGLGMIPGSGLQLREEWRAFDADANIPVDVEPTKENKGCICGNVLQGIAKPDQCALFGTECTPEHPVGACMVSSEGTCAAWYKYRGTYAART
jgi:hydrogenase expression/formation protein HypD